MPDCTASFDMMIAMDIVKRSLAFSGGLQTYSISDILCWLDFDDNDFVKIYIER